MIAVSILLVEFSCKIYLVAVTIKLVYITMYFQEPLHSVALIL